MFLGGHGIFKVSPLKSYVLVRFLLNGIEDKYSRFISNEQFHLMVPASFQFRTQM